MTKIFTIKYFKALEKLEFKKEKKKTFWDLYLFLLGYMLCDMRLRKYAWNSPISIRISMNISM